MSEDALYKYLREMKEGLTNHITITNDSLKEDINELRVNVKEKFNENYNFRSELTKDRNSCKQIQNEKMNKIKNDVEDIKKECKNKEKKKLITVERALIMLGFAVMILVGLKDELF